MTGIFDSGLGGLTAFAELRRLLPREDIVYFGDTGRVPYGTRSRETIIRYATEDMKFLLSYKVDRVLAACGTVSSVALDSLKEQFDIPIIGVVGAAAAAAVRITKNKKIGVIGTGATIKSGAYEREIRAVDGEVKVTGVACPLFVPLVENGYIGRECGVTREVARDYLSPLASDGVDTLILGCTHFPIIADIISDILPGVTLVNSGAEAAREIAKCASDEGGGKTEFYVSDNPENFSAIAEIFLGKKFSGRATMINSIE